MKSRNILLGAALVLASLAAQHVYAAITPVVPTAFVNGYIRNTKHDLSSSSTATPYRATSASAAADEVCVFCHTPHGAAYANGPLWNRGGPAAFGQAYNSTAASATDTMDSSILTAFAVTSAACMTCHDGVTALDNLINASGSGGYTAGGVARNYGNAGGSMGAIAAGVTNIGTDLRDDHPIGVAYCGGFLAAAPWCDDQDFVLAAGTGAVAAAQLVKNGLLFGNAAAVNSAAGADRFWIDVDGTPATRSKQDLVMFTRNFPAQSVNPGWQPSVECATCHDVHNSGNGGFLRMNNQKSALCFACHVK